MKWFLWVFIVSEIVFSPCRSFALGLETTMIPSISLRKAVSYAAYSVTTYDWRYGTIRTYSDKSGRLFAVTWSGSRSPSLASLGIVDIRTPGKIRNPHEENRIGNDFRLMRGGVMGHLWGKAWIPSMTPPGISPPDGLP